KVKPYFLNAILVASKDYWKTVANSTRKDPNITKTDVLNFKLPLPPLATQQAIVAEIEAEQALVAANRELITRFEQKIQATLARVWGEDDLAPAEGKGREERNARLPEAPEPCAAPARSEDAPLEKPVFP
ncbi:MAG: restriction endonuclease subunit S, partial [Rhodanobacter sp.]